MTFKRLSEYLSRLEKTSSRIEITKILSSLFKESKDNEVEKISYLVLGQLAPQYESVLFNMAEKMMLKAIVKFCSVDEKKVKEIYKQTGDIGETVSYFSEKGKDSGTSVLDVYSNLKKIALLEGLGSQDEKVSKMADLLSEVDFLSARYLARIPVGKLRLGFSDKTILDALSWMESGDKSNKKIIESAYQVLPDVGKLAYLVKTKGIKGINRDISPIVGTPVLPMLSQRLKTAKEMIEKMTEVGVEPKLDGLRLQLHIKKGKNGFIKAYTRNLNENSWMFPELKIIEDNVKAKEVVFDCEAVGVDEQRKMMAGFQSTMTRRRKHGIGEYSAKTPVSFNVFDVVLVEKKNMMNKSYTERRRVLKRIIKPGRLFKLVPSHITDKQAEIVGLYEKYIDQGYEGIMVKKIDSKYVPGRTGWRWVKMKQAEKAEGKLTDTLDLVIMGYTLGKGKRAGFGVGQFLAGIADKGLFKTITKVGTGITDEEFHILADKLNKNKTKKIPKNYLVQKDYLPDYWTLPRLVVEIAGDEITESPKHTSGFAIRFPRLLRFREDKGVADITSAKEVKEMYKSQKNI